MANTDFIKPTSVTQTTAATEISWNLDTSAYNRFTGCSTTEPLTSFSSKNTGLLIFSGWDTTVVPPNNNLDAVFVDAFSVVGQETDAQGMTFNNDGTKMYVCGKVGDDVNEYALSSAFDVSTASYTTKFGVGGELVGDANKPMGVQFNADGTKMFVLDEVNDRVNEYTLSTGFDLASTVAYIDSFSVAGQELKPTGFTFNTDGTKMFVVGWKGNDVNEYTLTTGFDLSAGVSFVDSFSVVAQNADIRDVKFSTDGTVMFIMGRKSLTDSVYRYTLTTGFDVSTATFEDFFYVGDQETAGNSIAFNTAGTKMFVLGTNSESVNEYTLSTAWDFSPVTTTVDGIEVKIIASKRSRIVDSIVQLAQSGSVIGANQATSQINTGNDYTYGTNISVWDATLTHSDLSTLQVAVKYTSDDTPHSDTAYVYSVQLKIHYT